MRSFLTLALLLLTAMTDSQNTPPLDSTTLVPDKVFTDGIEGPAVGLDGRIFLVNFAREGTIGVVTPQGQAELFVNLPTGSIANGIRFGPRPEADLSRPDVWSRDLVMYVADYTAH